MTPVFIGLGSNIEPESNINKALKLLNMEIPLNGISTFYLTGAVGRPHDPFFYNGAVRIFTDYSPEYLKFSLLRVIEAALGRKRSPGGDRFLPRTMDLDILAYGSLSIHNDRLDIPDPDIRKRPYLAAELSELDAQLYFPEWGLGIENIFENFNDYAFKPLIDYTGKLREEYPWTPKKLSAS
ncbi:MAG: 2-amino-4-hydroxy-6-hydroxymethyldihydropteridine diphosphokinase [Brevinematales bacterium]